MSLFDNKIIQSPTDILSPISFLLLPSTPHFTLLFNLKLHGLRHHLLARHRLLAHHRLLVRRRLLVALLLPAQALINVAIKFGQIVHALNFLVADGT